MVITIQRLQQDFPEKFGRIGSEIGSGLIFEQYSINPLNCQTKLGRWLADVIDSTLFDDDSSKCSIILPFTEEGIQIRDFARQLTKYQSMRNLADLRSLHAKIDAWLSQRQEATRADKTLFRHRVINFKWPVFGSHAAENARTPEQYFDVCADQIMRTGGVIRHAGNHQIEPPAELIKLMANDIGGGMALMSLFNKQAELSNQE